MRARDGSGEAEAESGRAATDGTEAPRPARRAPCSVREYADTSPLLGETPRRPVLPDGGR